MTPKYDSTRRRRLASRLILMLSFAILALAFGAVMLGLQPARLFPTSEKRIDVTSIRLAPLAKVCPDADGNPAIGAIEQCVSRLDQGTEASAFVTAAIPTIDRNFTEPDRGRLHSVLALAARDANGVTEDTLTTSLNSIGQQDLRTLLDILMNDGYLNRNDGGRYSFRMNLLREWWLRYVVL